MNNQPPEEGALGQGRAGGDEGSHDEALLRETSASAAAAAVAHADQPSDAQQQQQQQDGQEQEPIMIRLVQDPTLAARITALELEDLFQDIQEILQACSVPLLQLAQAYNLSEDELEVERQTQSSYIGYISMLSDRILVENRNDDDALVSYFRRSICTPMNLEALLKIIDPDVRTDYVRTLTLCLVEHLATRGTVWSEKLSSGLRFATEFLFQLAKSLERRADDDDEVLCSRPIPYVMLLCIDVSKDAPIKILNRVCKLDWSAILESPRANHHLFVGMAQMLLELYNLDECEPEVAVMLQSFGSCFGMFRRVLQRILRLRSLNEASSPEQIHDAMKWMNEVDQFVSLFYACMTGPPPREIERELDVLLSCAHSTLVDARPYVVHHLQTCMSGAASMSWLRIELFDALMNLIQHPGIWTAMKAFSPRQREKNRKQLRCSNMLTSMDKNNRKDARRSSKQFLRRQSDIQTEETGDGTNLCVNCLKTARDLTDERLQKCSLCKKVSYCNRTCQLEHWKRIHRRQCSGNEKKKK